jgi:peptidoglycan/LPS O-acetylase OafA/YrhL
VASGSWAGWEASGFQWGIVGFAAPILGVLVAAVMSPRYPRIALVICALAALFFLYATLGFWALFGIIGLAYLPPAIAICLVGAAIRTERKDSSPAR